MIKDGTTCLFIFCDYRISVTPLGACADTTSSAACVQPVSGLLVDSSLSTEKDMCFEMQ